jgi:hypothetical protein
MKPRLLSVQPQLLYLMALLLFCPTGLPSPALAGYELSRGQTVYVPVYSNIYSAPRKIPYNLSALLSIRNTDPISPITLLSVDYYDTAGRLVRRYYRQPVTLSPLKSVSIFIPEEDTAGGEGATFIVRWNATREVNVPIIESVMIGMKSGQGISFISPGREIRDSRR